MAAQLTENLQYTFWKWKRKAYCYSTQRDVHHGKWWCFERLVGKGGIVMRPQKAVACSTMALAKNKAYKRYLTAKRRSNARSEDKLVRSTALLEKADTLRKRGQDDLAATIELEAHALRRAHEREMAEASRPKTLEEIAAEAAANIEAKKEEEAREKRERLERLQKQRRRWESKLKLANTKITKLTRKIRRLEREV
jgi:hypothetical protein